MPITTTLIDFVGVPFNSAGTIDGVARAPTALRRAGLIDSLTGVGLLVSDRGDLDLPQPIPERDPDSHVIALSSLAVMIERVRGAVAESFERGAFPPKTQTQWQARPPLPSADVGRGGCTSTSTSSPQTVFPRSTTHRLAVSTGRS